MRTKNNILAIALGSLLSLASFSAIGEAKIGVANLQRAILQSESGKKLVEQIKSAFSEQEEVLKERQKEITEKLEILNMHLRSRWFFRTKWQKHMSWMLSGQRVKMAT